MKSEQLNSVFLTVGTFKQKQLCEKLLVEISEKYNLDISVVADDECGLRIGSGGAFLRILKDHYKDGQKMLIINCGGFSKRAMNYSLRGKAFANVEYGGEVFALIDLLILNMLRLFDRFDSGCIVCCSDILVETDNLQIDFDNNIGFCVQSDYETGSRHGVMFCNEQGLLVEYPHKSTASSLQSISQKYDMNCVFIDTGLLYFTNDVCRTLKATAASHHITETLISGKTELNLYADIVSLFAKNTKNNKFFNSENQSSISEHIINTLCNVLSDFTMKVCVLQDKKFLHFGSTSESLTNLLNLANKENSFLSLQSYIDDSSSVGKNTALDNVILQNGCIVGAGCLISDITLDGAVVGNEKSVFGVKLHDGSYVTVECDINENPKDFSQGTELWELDRFYKGKSYNDSLKKLRSNSPEIKYSLHYLQEHADVNYYFNRLQYLKDKKYYEINYEYLKKREHLINQYFKQKSPMINAICKKNKVLVSLPVRVNFSGTWTDAMPYCIDNGGQVINMAVTVDGQLPITVIAEKLPYKAIEFCSDNNLTEYQFENIAADEDLSDFNLHIAALQVMGITKETAFDCGFRLTTKVSGIDKGSGLGTSSILLGGCIQALSTLFGITCSAQEKMKMVFVAEQIMKTGGGWQDQVGGILPSIKLSSSNAGNEQTLKVQYLCLPQCFRTMFAEKLVLIPTGQRHFGRFIVNDVVNRYIAGTPDSVRGHNEIKELNNKVLDSIKTGSTEDFIQCLNRHFEILKKISPLVTNDRIDSIASSCLTTLADAVSICGAGGGGYLLGILKKDITFDEAKKMFKKAFPFITSDIKKADIFE